MRVRGEDIGSEDTEAERGGYPSDVQTIALGEREFVLVGTAHISRESADLVREVIETEKPDCVCLELDPQRYEALSHEQSFDSLDLKEIIRRRQLTTLFLNLLLASYQKQLGGQLGVIPGSEMLAAAQAAMAQGVPIALCDRDVRATLRRAWSAMSFWQKILLLHSLLTAAFEKTELTEDDLRDLRQQDVGSKLIQELGAGFPGLKRVLIDERDTYLTQKMKAAAGKRIVAVVGAGHVSGIRASLLQEQDADLAALEVIPPASAVWKWVGWGIPVLILGSLGVIGCRRGAAAAGENLLFWVFANGVPSMIGAILALAHPATVITAFVAAPITSLTPVIGAGYVAAFAQTYFRPPLVREFHTITQDFTSPRRWWTSRLLRIFLVFLLTTVGSLLGTVVGGLEIVSNAF